MANNSSEKLKAWRVEHGLTHAQAARRFNVSRMTWFRWEAALVRPNADTLAALCAAIAGLTPNDFYAGTVPAQKEAA